MIKLMDIITEGDVKSDYVPPKLYHATFEPLVNMIAKKGLIPGGTTIKAFEWSDPKYVFLAANERSAREIIESADNPKIPVKWKDKISVLTIDGNRLDKNKLFVDDEVFLKHLGIKSFKYSGVIPSSLIIDYGD